MGEVSYEANISFVVSKNKAFREVVKRTAISYYDL
jgi:hypothetical protein